MPPPDPATLVAATLRPTAAPGCTGLGPPNAAWGPSAADRSTSPEPSHSSPAPVARAPSRRRIAVVGMPNTGKSTLFNRMTGVQAKVANWPGMTVDLLTARIILGGRTVEVVDLPGLYSLHGFGEDERIVRHFLEQEPIDVLVAVVDATQIERQLPLVLQLEAIGLPLIVAVNLADEAQRLGIRIDTRALSVALGSPVLLVSAKRGTGIRELMSALRERIEQQPRKRGEQRVASALSEDGRLEREAERIVRAGVHIPLGVSRRITDRLDRALLHPVWGLPAFLALVFLLFQAVYGIGEPLQDGLQWAIDAAKGNWLEPALASSPPVLRSFLLEGVVDGVGTVLTFLPIILVFFVLMAVVEDSGYLVRVAFLMDQWMNKLGLDGRTFVMQLMGLGCNVPAVMGTRVVRARGQRLLSMLVIPFSLCSARLQVLVFLAAAFFSPVAAPIVMFSLYLISFLAAFGSALLWQRRFRSDEPMVLEFPPYRLPTPRALLAQGWQSSRHFLQGASAFILAGVLLIWLLTHYPFGVTPAGPESLAGRLASQLAPVFAPIGIDQILSVALLFGFVAKEIVLGGMAVIYGAGQDQLAQVLTARLDWVQAYSFMLFTLVYTPCLSTVAAIRRESKSLLFTGFAVLWPLAVAWVFSFVFYRVATALVG